MKTHNKYLYLADQINIIYYLNSYFKLIGDFIGCVNFYDIIIVFLKDKQEICGCSYSLFGKWFGKPSSYQNLLQSVKQKL